MFFYVISSVRNNGGTAVITPLIYVSISIGTTSTDMIIINMFILLFYKRRLDA